MADDQGDEVQEVITDDESTLDPLAGQELFEVPADLDEEEPSGAPEPGTKADPAEAEPPAGKPGEPKPRDQETGKFIPKEDAPAQLEGQPPEGAQAEAPAPGQAAEPEEPELEFSFRADNTQIPVAGSKLTKDWLMIPRKFAPDVQRLMSHGVVYQGSFRQKLTEAAQREADTRAEVHESVEKADHFLTFYADLAKRTQAGETDDQGRTPLEAWLDDFARNSVKLEADAVLAAAKAFRERKSEPVRLEGFDDDPAQAGEPAEIDLEKVSEELLPTVTEHVTNLAKLPEFRGLTGAELTRIRDYMGSPANISRFVMEVRETIPAAEWGGKRDLQVGERVVMPAFRQEFAHHAKLILDARKSALELSAAASKNAANGKNQIPPTTAVNGNGAPRGAKVPPKFKTKEEMVAWYNAEDPLS